MNHIIKKIVDYVSKMICDMRIKIVLCKYKIDTKSFEDGRIFGYQKGFLDGTKLRAQRSEGVSADEYNGLIRYLTVHNLEIYYCLNSPDGTGLMVRYKSKTE